MRATETLRVLRRDEGKAALLASIGVRFMVDGDRSGGGFALVEHPTPARSLAAPLHRHSREDEYGRRLGTRGDWSSVEGRGGRVLDIKGLAPRSLHGCGARARSLASRR